MSLAKWFYRGGRPNRVARVLNLLGAAVYDLGVAPNYLITLEVPGRRSGRTIKFPLVMAVVAGERYLVSMLGERANWVRNLRAAGGRATLRHGRREQVRLEEVAPEHRAPVLKAYLKRAPGARPHLPIDKDAPLAEFERVSSRFPVYKVLTEEPSNTTLARSALKERIKTRVEHEVDTRSVGFAAGLIRLTKGRVARLWRRKVLLLTTRGRKSGREHTVPLQFFPDGEDMIVVAANSGLPSPPGWYFNLTADPSVRVEVGDRTMQVHAQELSDEEAASFWPRVLQIAPDYAKYPRRTSRRIPLMRLVPETPTGSGLVSGPAAGASRNAGRQPVEIAPNVYWLRTGRAITESNVYFVHSGSSWALIDAAWPNRAPAIKQAAEALFGADAPPTAILLTHIHRDHAGSALELARTWGCPVYVHPDELPFAAPDIPTVERYANPLDRRLILPLLRAMPRRRAESASPKPSLRDVTRTFDPLGSVPGLPDWECIPTPGHTPGHVAFFRGSERILIAGDALSTVNLNSLRDFVLQVQKLSGPPYITTWNWRAAKESVGTLARLEPSVIAGGHGIPMTAGSETARNLRAFADRFSGHAAATGGREGAGG